MFIKRNPRQKFKAFLVRGFYRPQDIKGLQLKGLEVVQRRNVDLRLMHYRSFSSLQLIDISVNFSYKVDFSPLESCVNCEYLSLKCVSNSLHFIQAMKKLKEVSLGLHSEINVDELVFLGDR